MTSRALSRAIVPDEMKSFLVIFSTPLLLRANVSSSRKRYSSGSGIIAADDCSDENFLTWSTRGDEIRALGKHFQKCDSICGRTCLGKHRWSPVGFEPNVRTGPFLSKLNSDGFKQVFRSR